MTAFVGGPTGTETPPDFYHHCQQDRDAIVDDLAARQCLSLMPLGDAKTK